MMLSSFIHRNLQIFGNPLTARILSLFLLTILLTVVTGCSNMQNVVLRDIDKIQFGVASYYGKEFHGNKTSCGEVYDMNQLTAAHRALPFGTLVKVTNTKNGKAVVVKINDRGPHNPRRVIDLSYAAASELGMVTDGIVRVRLDVVDRELAGMEPWDGQEFQGQLTLNKGLQGKNQLPTIQLYSPFESPIKNTNLKSSKLNLIDNDLSQQIAGISGL